jgi:fatty acid desaturase
MPLNMGLDLRTVEEPRWYRVQLERQALKQLMGRTNAQGLFYFGSYLALLALFGSFAALDVLPTWARVFSFMGFAIVYCFSEAILHETGHRTAFRTAWLNEAVHYVAGVMAFKEPLRDRWVHAAHHTYTSYPELDPEAVLEPPPSITVLALDMFRIRLVLLWLRDIVRNAISADELTMRLVPPSGQSKIAWSARIMVVYYAAIIASSVVFQTWWPILFVFAARFAGAWLHAWITFVQHAGLAMNVPDWRLNTRTVLTNPLNRFLVWNMTYHIEHHMYPTVPFHRLPALHAEIKDACPPAYRSTFSAWRELLPALWQQRRDPTYFIQRPIPAAAL